MIFCPNTQTHPKKGQSSQAGPSSDPQNVQQTMLILRSKSTNKVCNCTVGPLGIFFLTSLYMAQIQPWQYGRSTYFFRETKIVPPKGSSSQGFFTMEIHKKSSNKKPSTASNAFDHDVFFNLSLLTWRYIIIPGKNKKHNLYLVVSTDSKNICYKINWFISPK